jgi:hypothetical protein
MQKAKCELREHPVVTGGQRLWNGERPRNRGLSALACYGRYWARNRTLSPSQAWGFMFAAVRCSEIT